MSIQVQIDDLADGKVEHLLESHLAEMHKHSPKDSIHALDKQKMRDPSMTFWSVRMSGDIAGCGALRQLDKESAELKSMKTNDKFLRMGVAEALLREVIVTAEKRGYKALYLETGSDEAFAPAVKLYQKYGFNECEPFFDYKLDPYSRFFVKWL